MQPDVIVVGGGFAGLSAAIQLARARRRVLVVDAGRPRNRFAKYSHGVPGHDGKPPLELLGEMRAQLTAYPGATVLEDEALSAVAAGSHFHLELAGGDTLNADRLVLATGQTDLLPDIPGLSRLWGDSVFQCPYCHGFEAADRRWGVLMTGEPSLHQAKLIPEWSRDVTFFTNGSDKLSPDQIEDIQNRGYLVEEAPLSALEGEEQLQAVRLADGRAVPLDVMTLVTRTRPASPLAEQLGCEMQEGPFGPLVKADNLRGTSVPGVFVAGDAANAMANVTVAMAQGVTAGIFAHQSMLGHRNPYLKSEP